MLPKRPGFKPYFIKPETIHVGDTIRATWSRNDVVASATGRVHHVEADGPTRMFYTVGGELIFTYIPGGKSKVRITLIDPAPSRQQATLFEVDAYV